MEKSKRLFYIEILQAFGILCVFLGHALRIYHEGGWYFHNAQTVLAFDIIDKFIFSFHMPLFVFLSGFLFYLNRISLWKLRIQDLAGGFPLPQPGSAPVFQIHQLLH